MSDLEETGRALLALAADAHDPTDQDRARVRTALAARLGAAAGLGVGTAVGVGVTAKAAASVGGAASTGGAAAAVGGGALATKLVGVAVVLTTTLGVGTAVKLARRSEHARAAAKTSETTLEAHARRPLADARRDGLVPPSSDVPVAATAPSDEPMPAPRVRGPAPAVSSAPSRGAPPAPPTVPIPTAVGAQAHERIDSPDTTPSRRPEPVSGAARACPSAISGANAGARSEAAVADEARLVHDGVLALRAGQAACALSLLDTHARFYPDGVLAEEREAERALALAELGRLAEARAAATEFLRKHPASPLGVRLRRRVPGLDVDAPR
jgi:hypothetical protein